MNSGFHGLRVTPHSRLWVNPAQLNSGVAVRMWMIPPAFWMRSMIGWSYLATSSISGSEPCLPRAPDHRLLFLRGDAQALERTRGITLSEVSLLRGAGLGAGLVVPAIDDGVEHGVVGLDLLDQALEMFHRRQVAAAEQVEGLVRGSDTCRSDIEPVLPSRSDDDVDHPARDDDDLLRRLPGQ